MANRAYLYSTNFVPGTETEERRIVGLSEWRYDIPIVFKLLLSGNPKRCSSLIWEEPDAIAVIGNYDEGVARLLEFLECVPHPAVAALAEEAREFLEADQNRNDYFLLEPNEIFDLGNDAPEEQADSLLAEFADLGPQMEKAIAELEARMHEEDHPPGFFARLFGARTPVRRDNSNDMVYAFGLGGWSRSLFYQPE